MARIKKNKTSDEYEVEHILAKRQGAKGTEYKIKWVGYPTAESTWEPLENLDNAQSAIDSFEANASQSSKNVDSELEENFSKAKIKYTKKKAEKRSESESSVSEKPKQKILRKKIEKKKDSDSESKSGKKITPTQEKQKKIKENEKLKMNLKQKEQEKERERAKEKEKEKSREKEKADKSKSKKKEESANRKVLIDNLSNEENQGSFKLKDLPKRIVHCQIDEKEGVKFEVEWKKRKNGEKPENTMFFSKELRKYDPEIIIDFYEARLSFVK